MVNSRLQLKSINWPGDAEGAQGPELMGPMRRHVERFGTQVIEDHIQAAYFKEKPFRA